MNLKNISAEDLDTLKTALREYDDRLISNPHQFGFDDGEADALEERKSLCRVSQILFPEDPLEL